MNEVNELAADPFERVKDLLVREFRIKPRKIKPEARIREDLGICGDDGLDLFTALHEQCGVDLSEYDQERSFEPEAFGSGALFTSTRKSSA